MNTTTVNGTTVDLVTEKCHDLEYWLSEVFSFLLYCNTFSLIFVSFFPVNRNNKDSRKRCCGITYAIFRSLRIIQYCTIQGRWLLIFCAKFCAYSRAALIWVNMVHLNSRVFLLRNYWLIVAPQKFYVLKTNICPRSKTSRVNMLVLRTSTFQGTTIRLIVLRQKRSCRTWRALDLSREQ